ncbi:MAG: hypothetical protein E6249_06690 [Peptoniphilus grossensis]|uniref:hypothetical protein n=1 Tax=Peptoniphilus grossensis TaxID=1465756 RepID=UPI00258EFB25|nr:hypothetical protein [Peptoniphilus grossensis]MDU5100143.1 hypothetical protein [Peptoniphilus grossensis]
MKKYFVIFLSFFVLFLSVISTVSANNEKLGFDDDTIFVKIVKYRYDRDFPSFILYTDFRAGKKFRGNLKIDRNSIQKESDNIYRAIYEGTLYDVGYASYALVY